MKLSTVFLFLLLFSAGLMAQTSDSIYQQYLLNNHNVPKRVYYTDDSKNIIKTNIFSIIDGNLPIIWEHKFDNCLGFEIGPGIILPYTFFDIIGQNKTDELFKPSFPFIINPTFSNRKLGVSFQVEPKLYLGNVPWGSLGTFYSLKSYSKLLIHEIGFAFNFIDQYPGSKNFASQMGITFSYLNQIPLYNVENVKYIGTVSNEFSSYGLPKVSCFLLAFRLQVGYLFDNQIKQKK